MVELRCSATWMSDGRARRALTLASSTWVRSLASVGGCCRWVVKANVQKDFVASDVRCESTVRLQGYTGQYLR